MKIKQLFCRHYYGPFVAQRKLKPADFLEEVPSLKITRLVRIEVVEGSTVCVKCGRVQPCIQKNYMPHDGDPFLNSKPTEAQKKFSDELGTVGKIK